MKSIQKSTDRIFILSIVLLVFYSFSLSAQNQQDRVRHYLPKTESQYKATSSYIEEDPVPEYSWASEKAYEDFKDIKYGIRIHWGLYSIIRQEKESWPFLKKSNAEKQA